MISKYFQSFSCFRDWVDYTEGFGDIYGNYWLGLDDLVRVLHTGVFELFVYLESFEPNENAYARYQIFNVRHKFT